VAYIYARQTNRRPSDGGVPVSDQQFAELRQSVRESDVEVIGINDRARMAPLLAIFDRGMVIECETRRTFEESRVWFRFNERERAEEARRAQFARGGRCRSTVASAGVVSEAR
jgi:hypothetical protein